LKWDVSGLLIVASSVGSDVTRLTAPLPLEWPASALRPVRAGPTGCCESQLED
jgi:hypothetical protein